MGPMGLIGHIGLIRFSYNKRHNNKEMFILFFCCCGVVVFKRVIWLYFDNYLSKIDIA